MKQIVFASSRVLDSLISVNFYCESTLEILLASVAEKTFPCQLLPFVLAPIVQLSELPHMIFRKIMPQKLPDSEPFCVPIDTNFTPSADLYLRDASRLKT